MLAAQVSYGCPPETSAFSNSTGFNQCRVKFAAAQSSLTYANHFFLGLLLARDPPVRPNNAVCGNLKSFQLAYETHVQKYVSRRIRRSSMISLSICNVGWLGSRVVSLLDSGAGEPGFISQSRRCRLTVLGKLFTPIVPLFTKQQKW